MCTSNYVRTYETLNIRTGRRTNLRKNKTNSNSFPLENMIFSSNIEYENSINHLKEELKTQITKNFDGIFQECWYGTYDVWGHVLNDTKPLFLRFCKGHKDEWCNKTSMMFENTFDCVLEVAHKTMKRMEVDVLLVFVDSFFDKREMFDEEWFWCSKCLKTTGFFDDVTNTCLSCASQK